MTFTDDLCSDQIERLALLAEECGEVVQAVSKILRHGFDSEFMDEPNRTALAREIGDVLAAVVLLTRSADLGEPDIWTAADRKLGRLLKYTHHQGPELMGPLEAPALGCSRSDLARELRDLRAKLESATNGGKR